MAGPSASRLRLEPLRPCHADALYRLYAEPEVARFLLRRAETRAEFEEIFERSLRFAESHGMWAIFAREGSELLGRVGFYAFGEAARPELAFLLAPSAWGRGIATEACRAALAHARSRHRWSEVIALVRPANAAAMRVLDKLGFAVESEPCLVGEPVRLYRRRYGT